MKPKRIVKAINKIKEIEDRFNISSLKSNHDGYWCNIKKSENPFSKSEYSTYWTYLRYSEIVRKYKEEISAEKNNTDNAHVKDASVNSIHISSGSSDTNLASIPASSNKNIDIYIDNPCRSTEEENVKQSKQQTNQNLEKRVNGKDRPPLKDVSNLSNCSTECK